MKRDLLAPFRVVSMDEYFGSMPPNSAELKARAAKLGGSDDLARHSLIDDCYDAQRANARLPEAQNILIF